MKQWLLLLFLSIFLWLIDGGGYSSKITQPLRRKVYQEKIGKENDNQWRAKVAIAEAELNRIKTENETLRGLLEAPLSPSWQFVPAQVLNLKNNVMSIDVGSKMGILEDQVVMGYVKKLINNGVVVGKISKVNMFESEVELLSGKGMMIKVKSETGATGVVKGDGDKIILEEVLQKFDLAGDDLLLTEGDDGWLPSLVVGRVGVVEKQEAAVFQSAEVKLMVELESLSEVWVVSR